jgi:hypothetical protein
MYGRGLQNEFLSSGYEVSRPRPFGRIAQKFSQNHTPFCAKSRKRKKSKKIKKNCIFLLTNEKECDTIEAQG